MHKVLYTFHKIAMAGVGEQTLHLGHAGRICFLVFSFGSGITRGELDKRQIGMEVRCQ